MPDLSSMDLKYFIDQHVYNCPFCNRRNVQYFGAGHFSFDWKESKRCYGYLVQCASCENTSMHLSFTEIKYVYLTGSKFLLYPNGDLDDLFFYSVPSSFYVMDERVPRVLRELLAEAEGCLKSNFLTGASACARKLVYELAIREKAQGQDYESRLKSLKELRQDVDPAYFDTLLTIQQVTSTKVHEESYDGWQSKHLRLILASLQEVLSLLYVEPQRREERRKAILDLKDEIVGNRNAVTSNKGKDKEERTKESALNPDTAT